MDAAVDPNVSWSLVDDSNFEAVVVADSFRRPVVALLGASWCGHCGPLAEDLDAVLEHLEGRIGRAKLWVDRPALLRAELSETQASKSTVHRSLKALGSPTGLPRTFIVQDGQVLEGFAGRPTDDGFLVRFSTWLQSLSAGEKSTRSIARVRAAVRRQGLYRTRMGLGLPLPHLTIGEFGVIPDGGSGDRSSH